MRRIDDVSGGRPRRGVMLDITGEKKVFSRE